MIDCPVQKLHRMEPVHGLGVLGHLCSGPQRACLCHVAGGLLDLRAVPSVPLGLVAEPAHGTLAPSSGDGHGAMPVGAGHDADAALAAPPCSAVNPDAHGIGAAGGISIYLFANWAKPDAGYEDMVTKRQFEQLSMHEQD